MPTDYTVDPADVPVGASILRVRSLDGYSPLGGTLIVNGHIVTYTGTFSDLVNPVEGVRVGTVTLNPIQDNTGQLVPGAYHYHITAVTRLGETAAIASTSPVVLLEAVPIYADIINTKVNYTQVPAGGIIFFPPTITHTQGPVIGYSQEETNAIELWILGVAAPPEVLSQITALNVYRYSNEPARDGDNAPQENNRHIPPWFVGSVGPRGGTLIDKISRANLAPCVGIPPVSDASEVGWFLTGCTWAEQGAVEPGTFVVVDDVPAQLDMAARLRDGSDGVIEGTPIQGGNISREDAIALGVAFLRQAKEQVTVAVAVQDSLANAGQILDVHMPAPVGDQHLKIQQSNVRGFEVGVPHEHEVTAATIVTSFEELMQQKAKP